jgi:hypothetical protein
VIFKARAFFGGHFENRNFQARKYQIKAPLSSLDKKIENN